MEVLERIIAGIRNGDASAVAALTREALANGAPPEDVLGKGFLPGMDIVGKLFKKNEIFIPEVLIAAQAMKAGMSLIRPLLAGSGVRPAGKVVIGTVKGDLHDIGKNIVILMLEGAGFEVVDLGYDVPRERFMEAVVKEAADILGMSALLTTTMASMKDVIQGLEAAGMRTNVKVMIGGAPVTQSYADEIKADGYAPDAASAADLARALVGP